MNNLVYREITKDDFDGLINLLQETWNFEDAIHDHQSRMRFLHLLLSSTMLTSSWGQVSIHDNEIVGFIMGLAKKDKTGLQKTFSLKVMIINMASLFFLNRSDKKGVESYFQVPKAYNSMRKGRAFSAEITLLAVSKKCQGLGIGKHLVNNVLSYFSSMAAGSIGVFTDSESNYGFYDHSGFERIDARTIGKNSNVPEENKTIYLYQKIVKEHK
jgi:ribosomal protein S18 acetylase RimI-like enzyme